MDPTRQAEPSEPGSHTSSDASAGVSADGGGTVQGPPIAPEVVTDAPAGLLVVSGDGRVRYANSVARTWFAQEPLIGSTFGLPLTSDRTEVELLTGHGGTRVVEMRSRRATWAGERVHIVWLHDVTGLVGRQRELTSRLAMLEASIANVAHDVRSPIAAARGLVELTQVDDEDGVRNLEAAVRNLRHAESVLTDLVERDRDRRDAAPPGRVELWSVLASASDSVVQHDVEIEARGPIDELAVLARRREVEQILRNLLTNAVRHGEPPILVDVEEDAGQVVVRVTDHGPGVPSELRERLFNRYAHGEGGTGLGLAIVRGLTESAGGQVRYVGEAPGASFEVRLPSA